jgi:hypothetical protein
MPCLGPVFVIYTEQTNRKVFLRRPVIAFFFYPALVLFEQLHLPDIFAIFDY